MLAGATGADTIPSCSHRAAESSHVGPRLGSWGQSSLFAAPAPRNLPQGPSRIRASAQPRVPHRRMLQGVPSASPPRVRIQSHKRKKRIKKKSPQGWERHLQDGLNIPSRADILSLSARLLL